MNAILRPVATQATIMLLKAAKLHFQFSKICLEIHGDKVSPLRLDTSDARPGGCRGMKLRAIADATGRKPEGVTE
jgi:hypothetical protein